MEESLAGHRGTSLSAHARGVTDRIPEVAYLNTEETPRYRLIMRYMYQENRLHHNNYSVSFQAIFDHMCKFEPEYTEALCRRDLDQLAAWGGIDEDRARSTENARTIAELKRHNLYYGITPIGIVFEEAALSVERMGRQVGELESSAMEEIWRRLDELEQAWRVAKENPGQIQALPEAWRSLWNRFDEMAKNANDYMSNMHRQEQEHLLNLDIFFLYKEALTTYLTRFIDTLTEYREAVWARLTTWDASDLVPMLVDAAKTGDRRWENIEILQQEFSDNARTLRLWFSPEGGGKQMHEFAIHAIGQVAKAADRLSEIRPGGLSRGHDLLALAELFGSCSHLEQADRVAQEVFGLNTPRHWALENDSASGNPNNLAWHASPIETALPRKRAPRSTSVPSISDLVEEAEQERLLRERHRQQEMREALIADHLFVEGVLDVRAVGRLTSDERAYLLDWINQCVTYGQPIQIRADSSTISILNPQTTEQVQVRFNDGTMSIPAFRLSRRLWTKQEKRYA